MRKLTFRATRQALEFLRELYVLRTSDSLITHIVEAIPSLIPTDICSYNEMNSRRRHAMYKMWPANRPSIPDAPEILGKYSWQHPLVIHIERTKDFSSKKITDFVTQRQFRTTDLFNELYKPLQIPYNMCAGLALNSQCLIAIGLNRNGRDFTAAELTLLELIRPHIAQAFGNANAVTNMREELSALNRIMGEAHKGLIAFNSQGHIQWSTTRALDLMAQYGLQARRSDRLPSLIRDWAKHLIAKLESSTDLPTPLEPMRISRGERTLAIRLMREGGKQLLVFDETKPAPSTEDLSQLGLTVRETEILSWLARGKTNFEIGTILDISGRTVQKHLERIYGRLGVENRHAAIVMAIDAMKGSA